MSIIEAPAVQADTTSSQLGSFGSFTVGAFELKKALAQLKPAFGTYCAIGVLRNVKVVVSHDAVRISGSNLDLTITKPLVGAAPLVPGTFLVPFAQAVKLVAKATVKSDELVTVTADGLKVNFAKGKLSLDNDCLPAGEYPKVGPVDADKGLILVRTAVLADVLGAASNDDARPILTGVYFGGGDVAATDSYRLHVLRGVVDTGDDELIIQASAIKVVAKAGDECYMAWGARDVKFEFPDGLTIVSRLIEGTFPNFKGLVPANPPAVATFDRAEVIAAVAELARLVSGPTPTRLEVTATGVDLSMSEQDVNKASITVDATGTVDGFRVCFNPSFLGDVLNSLDADTATLLAIDSMKPALFVEPFAGGERLRLLMPVRF